VRDAQSCGTHATRVPIITLTIVPFASSLFVDVCILSFFLSLMLRVVASLLMRYTDGDLRAPQVICFVYNDWTEKKDKLNGRALSPIHSSADSLFLFLSPSHLFHFAWFPFPFFPIRTMVVTAHYSANFFFFLLLFIGRLQASCTRPLGDLLAMN
jgi:hypothetical protein